MTEEIETILVEEDDAGERLDKILAKRYQERQFSPSRTYFQNLIEKGLVLLNGQPVKKRIKPEIGDEIEIQFALTPEFKLVPENIPLNILYEDSDLIVVNKPAGMVVHPAAGNWTGTFVQALLFHCQTPLNDSIRPGIVHRLDKDTSGVLVAAKTISAQQKLTELFASRRIKKEYIAICLGNPGNGESREPIARHPVHRKKMAIVPEGKPAITTWRTVASDAKLSVVKINLITGRTHQIRVHMQHRGTPVLGDDLYGNAQSNTKYGVTRQMLHAERLSFEHPISGKPMEFVAPLDAEMQTLIEKIGSHHASRHSKSQ